MKGINFVNPSYLYFLLLGLIPVILHLFSKKKIRKEIFPSVDLILKSRKRVEKKVKLKNLLLLLLRVLLLLLLALLFARPMVSFNPSFLKNTGTNRNLVLLLDNSMSMAYDPGRGSSLDKARKAALGIIENIDRNDRVALMTMSSKPEKFLPGLTYSVSMIIDKISAVKPTYCATGPDAAVRAAFDMIKNEKLPTEIYVISDFFKQGWAGFNINAIPAPNKNVKFFFVDVAEDKYFDNRYIESAAYMGGGQDSGHTVELTAVSLDPGDREPMPVEIYSGSAKVNQGTLVYDRDKKKHLGKFSLSDNSGEKGCYFARLLEDYLTYDDEYFFTVESREELSVMIVDGDPTPSLFSSETYYLQSALSSQKDGVYSNIVPRVVSVKEWENSDFSRYRGLILANVPEITRAMADRLYRYAAAGGGIVIFCGGKVNTENYNVNLYGGPFRLMPGKFENSVYPAAGELINKVSAGHPAIQLLVGGGTKFSSAKFSGYLRVTPDRDDKVETLLSFSGGDPFLLERKIGAGFTYLFTSTADRDWTNFPSKPFYLPLIQQVIYYFAKEIKNIEKGEESHPGETLEVNTDIKNKYNDFILSSPEGETVKLNAADSKGRLKLYTQEIKKPGFYRVAMVNRQGKRLEEMKFAVNTSGSESFLEKISKRDLLSRFKGYDTIYLDEAAGIGSRIKNIKRGYEIWDTLLLVLFLFLAAEVVLANRI